MTTRREIRISISLSALVLFLCAAPLFAEVLVLDLDGDGLRLSDRYYPVRYDLDGDGRDEVLSWTAGRQNEAFLWRDVDGDGLPGAGELLTGFGQLRRWDRSTLGGNGDGVLTEGDRLWSELRLWIDRDHDGLPIAREVSRPGDWGVFEIGLATGASDASSVSDVATAQAPVEIDGGLNVLTRRSPCRRWDPRRSRHVEWEATLVEVIFDRRPAQRASSRTVRAKRSGPPVSQPPALPAWVPSALEPGL
jgi:hypothetical protein